MNMEVEDMMKEQGEGETERIVIETEMETEKEIATKISGER